MTVKAPLEVRNAELLPDDAVLIASRRWDSNGARLCVATQGQTLEAMVRQAVEKAYPGRDERFYSTALSWCRVRMDGLELKPIRWKDVRPQAGQRVEVLIAPGGGGGKKNPLALILQFVVVVVAVATQQYYAAAWGAKIGTALNVSAAAGQAIATAGIAMATAVANMAINALFPVSAPTVAGPESVDTSQTYSLNGGQNSANPNGYVPLVLGRHKMTPPLGAKSWTSYEGEDQFLHMLVVWGHSDMNVQNFRIGDTDLADYEDVTHVIHNRTTGEDLQIFGKSYNEQNVGAGLTRETDWVTRSIGEADEISFDISFPALGKANKETGKIGSYEVAFEAQCALEGSEEWRGIGSESFVVRSATNAFGGKAKPNVKVWTDLYGNVTISNGGKKPSAALSIYPSRDERVSGCNVSMQFFQEEEDLNGEGTRIVYWWEVTVTEGSVGAGLFPIKASQAKPLVKSFRSAVPNGEWRVRMRRISDDTDDNYIYDDATWSTVRAITNRAPFSTPVPLCCSELRIRASEQLSSYVSDFNADVASVVPVWNGTDWNEEAETDNPAALLRYVLTSRAGSYYPFGLAKLDDQSFAEFYEWCEDNSYTFNFICDTETLTWKRMVQIAAAGRGAVTFDNDGKVSVIIDRADKQPVQMFTPRNSWGFSVERTFQKYPHALRAKFRNAENKYEESNDYIYADGYTEANATNIVEWEAEGKTNWNEVWKFGRYYLASMRLRPESVTLSTDWEWRMCRRGDLVLVAHDVLTNVFGTARIVGLVYDVDGDRVTISREEAKIDGLAPVGVVLDDSVIFSEPAPARYGIAVRQPSGRVLTYEVQARYGEESNTLFFKHGLNSAQIPSIGALASVALFGNDGETEVGQYLVAGITPGDNMSADLTLIPYAPEIMQADKGTIPAWTAPVRLPGIPKRDNLPVPTIKEIRTDESVIIRSGDSLISRIAVWYGVPSSPDASLGEVQVQMQAKDDFGNVLNASAPLTDPFVAVQGVEDSRKYVVSLRLVSSRGVASAWTTPHTVVVVGKTSTPPEVEGFTASIADPQGVKLEWQASTVADFDHYEVSGAGGSLKTVNPGAVMPVYGKNGNLSFAVQAVDTVGLKSAKVEATVEVLPPAKPSPAYTVLPQQGTEVSWADCKTTWSISHYEVEDLWANTRTTYADPRFGVSPRLLGYAYRYLITAVDVFGNRGPVADFAASLGAMPTPVPAAKVDGTQVVVSWAEVTAPFAVDVYEVQTQEGVLIGKVKGTELRFEATKVGTHGYKVRGIDIAGNIGPWGECSLVLTAPKAPAVTAFLGGDDLARGADRIDLAWVTPASSLPVVAYDVVHQWEETRADGVTELREEDFGRMDALALVAPPVPVGSHSYLVRAVDSAGVHGPWGSATIVSRAPGKVTFQGCGAVDNNTMLYYTAPDSLFWRVKEYLVEDVQGEHSMEVGRVDVNFFARIENEAGKYTYGVTPVDVAGNLGTRATITINVTQPPDFIMYYDVDSTFGGEKVNMELDGRGSMIGPIPSETWLENAIRVAAMLGTSAEALTWQKKADGGMEYSVSPAEAMGAYSEVIDINTLIPSTKIMVTVSQDVLEGTPSMTCKIEVSEDGKVWRVAMENGLEVYEKNFRFIRVTFTWSGGLVSVGNINVRCDVKRKTDFGKAYCAANDNGEGWVSQQATPMLTGTWIPFNVDFVDVESLPKPNIVNDTSEGGLTAYTVFEDVHEPAGFRVFVLDKNGNRASATVDWAAYGV